MYKLSAKSESPCTASLRPELYQYVLQYSGETVTQKQFRQKCSSMDGAVMMAPPDEYQFIAWLCATIGAKRVIEVGVFRGVTALAIAKILPEDGVLRALEISREYSKVGMEMWAAEGVADRIDFVEGPAGVSMQKLLDSGEAGTYDFIFVDANKCGYVTYYELGLQLLRPGGIMALDNTLMGGAVVVPAAAQSNADVKLMMDLNERIKNDARVSAVMSIMADGVYFARKL